MRPFQQKKFIFQAMGVSILLSAIPYLTAILIIPLIVFIAPTNSYNSYADLYLLGLIFLTYPSLLGVPFSLLILFLFKKSISTETAKKLIFFPTAWARYLMIPAMIVLPIFWIASFLTIRGIAIIILEALWVADFIYIRHLHEKIEEKFFNEEKVAVSGEVGTKGL